MTYRFQVTGMTCAACSARVEKVSGKVPGVQRAEVNLLAGILTVTAEDERVVAPVIQAVIQAGYGAKLKGEKVQKKEPPAQDVALAAMKRRIIGSFVCLLLLMYLKKDFLCHLYLYLVLVKVYHYKT